MIPFSPPLQEPSYQTVTTRPMSLLSLQSYQRCSNVDCNFRCKVLSTTGYWQRLKPAELVPAVVLPVVHTSPPIPPPPSRARSPPLRNSRHRPGSQKPTAEQEGPGPHTARETPCKRNASTMNSATWRG